MNDPIDLQAAVSLPDEPIAELPDQEDKIQVMVHPPVPLPGEPTQALPGSEEKIQIMIQRAERREQLFHPQDGRGKKKRASLRLLTEAAWQQTESA